MRRTCRRVVIVVSDASAQVMRPFRIELTIPSAPTAFSSNPAQSMKQTVQSMAKGMLADVVSPKNRIRCALRCHRTSSSERGEGWVHAPLLVQLHVASVDIVYAISVVTFDNGVPQTRSQASLSRTVAGNCFPFTHRNHALRTRAQSDKRTRFNSLHGLVQIQELLKKIFLLQRPREHRRQGWGSCS